MPKIFISYRRDDTSLVVDKIYNSLSKAFGRANVFRDIHSIDLASNFEDEIIKALANCDFVLVIIGEKWINITDKTGNRRLASADDFVRLEVETALRNPQVKVIPVCIDNTKMPDEEDLPSRTLKKLLEKNGTVLHSQDPYFTQDIQSLIKRIKQLNSRKNKLFSIAFLILFFLILLGFSFLKFANQDNMVSATSPTLTSSISDGTSGTSIGEMTITPIYTTTLVSTLIEGILPSTSALTFTLEPSITPTSTNIPTQLVMATNTITTLSSMSFPCDATIVNPSSSATVITEVFAEASSTSPKGLSVRVGSKVSLQRQSVVANSQVWYLVYSLDGQRHGWLLSHYIVPSASCPK